MISCSHDQAGWNGAPGTCAYASSKFALEALTEVLSNEGAFFGIKAIVFEPGVTNTGIIKKTSPSRQHSEPAYDRTHKSGSEYMRTFSPLGDKERMVAAMIDVLARDETPLPARLPLGSDALEVVTTKCLETLKICQQWHRLIIGTDRDGVAKTVTISPFAH